MEHALHDTVERLAELPRRKDIEELRALADKYGALISKWDERPPDEATRVSLLEKVLALNVAVIRAGGERAMPSEPEEENTGQFPRPIR